jgi:hypothetical protein
VNIVPWEVIALLLIVGLGFLVVRALRRRGRQLTAASDPGVVADGVPGSPWVATETGTVSGRAVPPDLPVGGIFISYRRSDAAHAAHRLYDYLLDRFGPGSTFIDLDMIAPGADFVRTIDDAIARSRVLLAIIGVHWVDAATATGTRRLDDPGDLVRIEIERAMLGNVRVIPVLVDASMPSADQMPSTLRDLSRRNAVPLRLDSFRADCEHLADHLERVR